jgi:uncharacterized membrane protein
MSELDNDPILHAASRQARSGKTLAFISLGITVGNMVAVLALGLVWPLPATDAALPYAPLAVTGIALIVALTGAVKLALARSTTLARCQELMEAEFESRTSR